MFYMSGDRIKRRRFIADLLFAGATLSAGAFLMRASLAPPPQDPPVPIVERGGLAAGQVQAPEPSNPYLRPGSKERSKEGWVTIGGQAKLPRHQDK